MDGLITERREEKRREEKRREKEREREEKRERKKKKERKEIGVKEWLLSSSSENRKKRNERQRDSDLKRSGHKDDKCLIMFHFFLNKFLHWQPNKKGRFKTHVCQVAIQEMDILKKPTCIPVTHNHCIEP